MIKNWFSELICFGAGMFASYTHGIERTVPVLLGLGGLGIVYEAARYYRKRQRRSPYDGLIMMSNYKRGKLI